MTSPPASYIPPDSGRFGFPVRLPSARGHAPLGIAAFLAVPLFFCSLMASTLALEKADKFQWKDAKCHPVCTVWHVPSTSTEAKIWLWAMVPSVVLALVGLIATRLPLGFYVSCLASIVIAMGVVHKTAIWEKHHIARFPTGIDLIPRYGYAFSNQWNRGQWEREARATALSLQHWTIGIALAAMLAMLLLWVRSRRSHPGYAVSPSAAIESTDGAPQITAG